MNPAQRRLLVEFVSQPTAPFVEERPAAYIRQFVAARPALRMRRDRFGNLLVTYRGPQRRGRGGRSQRPLIFAAHLDHPGFVASGLDAAGRQVADFRGWVDREYFLGAKVRFFAADGETVGTIVGVHDEPRPTARRNKPPALRRTTDTGSRSFRDETPPEHVTLRMARGVAVGTPGLWDIPAARVSGTRLWARVCDDLAGAAAILCALDDLCRRRAASACHAFFTRAEEVGFAGALAAVADGRLPKRAIVVAVECSKAIAGVAMGGGPVLRVGDKATIFSPGPTAWCRVVAERLAERDKSFCFQRKLMDGGTCESTAYCHFGYDATGVCLPLVNYHNMDREKRRLAPESIDLRDFENLTKWFVAMATSDVPATVGHPGLDERLRGLLKKHRPHLLATA